MDTPHRVAVFERTLLGGAAAAFAVIVALAAKDGALDASLRWAIRFALIAMPVLLALYVAKDAIHNWIAERETARRNLSVTQWALSLGLLSLAGSIACLAGHIFGFVGGGSSFIWTTLLINFSLKADKELGRGKEQ